MTYCLGNTKQKLLSILHSSDDISTVNLLQYFITSFVFNSTYNITMTKRSHIYGLLQERRNSIANALGLRLSCNNTLIYTDIMMSDICVSKLVVTGSDKGLLNYLSRKSIWKYPRNMSFCSGPWFNIKMTSYQYRKSHCGDDSDETILRPSHLHSGQGSV